MVFQQLRTLLLTILRLFRRALCCFSFGRRRKLSQTEPMEIRVVVDGQQHGGDQALSQSWERPPHQQQHAERDWNSWDDSPRTVDEHIEQYRQRLAKPPTPQTEESEPDFFKELTPMIKPQLKYYLGNGDERNAQTDFSRLEAKSDVPIAMNADLEDWVDDTVDGDWDELSTEQTKLLIREKRREMRQQRQQRITRTSGCDTSNIKQPTGQSYYSNHT